MSRLSDYENANGLVDGKIPKGNPCPFYSRCKMKTGNCPTQEHPKEVNFSCALARVNHYDRIIENTNSWKWTMSLKKEDIVLDMSKYETKKKKKEITNGNKVTRNHRSGR